MKNASTIVLVVSLIVAPTLFAQDEAGTTEGSVEIGAWDASTSGSPDLVTEYESDDGGAELNLSLDSLQDSGAISLDVRVRDDADQDLWLGFDLNRWIRSETDYTAMPHRLGHQPVEHFATATNHGRLTRNTDFDPGGVYEIDYSLLEHRTEFQPRSTGNLIFAVSYRHQERDGVEQFTTVSHCDSCHVVSRARPVDETTTDTGLEASYAWNGNRVRASFLSRSLEQGVGAITFLFDDALHPELRLPLFDNRLQFDSAEGPQSVDIRPDIDKEIYSLDGSFADVGGFAVNAEGVWSTTENRGASLQSDYSGAQITAARSFDKGWNMRWRARSYKLENDDVFIDLVERVGVAGPQAGRTYAEIYGFPSDYTRLSSLDRQVTESKLDFSRRSGKKKGSVRLFWEYEEVDRDHLEVAPGEMASTTNILGASWRARPKKGLKTYVSVEHGETDNTFALVDGAFSTLTSPAVPNPFDPNGAQYYEFHDARIADTTASPASWDEVKLRANYLAGSTSFTSSYRYWDGDNDDGDLTDWSRTVQALTLTLWGAPAPKWEWHTAYAWNSTELGTPASIPLFDG